MVWARLKTRHRCSGSGPDTERFVQDSVAADAVDFDSVRQRGEVARSVARLVSGTLQTTSLARTYTAGGQV